MLDDLLELVLDVGGELLFSRKKGEQGKPEGQPSVPDGGRRQQKSAFQPGKDPWAMSPRPVPMRMTLMMTAGRSAATR